MESLQVATLRLLIKVLSLERLEFVYLILKALLKAINCFVSVQVSRRGYLRVRFLALVRSITRVGIFLLLYLSLSALCCVTVRIQLLRVK